MQSGITPSEVDSLTSRELKSASRAMWLCAFSAFLVFLALSVGYSLTRGPWWDEGLFADVALSFRNAGHLRSTVLAPHTYLNLPGIDQHTYWQFPLYLVAVGTWFHIAPATIQAMRIFSVFWGSIYIASWFLFVRALSRNEPLALLVSSVVALDYSLVAAASNGRMEMMCAALGQLGLTAYVCCRDWNREIAVLLATSLGAASLFCHPMGVITSAFIAVLLVRDWRRMSWTSVILALFPYLFGGTLVLWYILQAPQIFLAQAKAASSYRVGGLFFILNNIVNDLKTRYVSFYFTRLSGLAQLKIFAFLFGAAGLIALAVNPRLRANSLVKLLLILSVVGYIGIAVIDNMKFPYYLVYITPILSACGAIWIYDSFRARRRIMCVIASALLTGYVGATIAGFMRNIYRDDFAHIYDPVVATVRKNLGPGDTVMGPSQLGFALGFSRPLIDDCYLGFVSGVVPKVYVMHGLCGPGFNRTGQGWAWSRKVLAASYLRVFANSEYEVYIRKNSTPTATGPTGSRAPRGAARASS